MIKCHAWKNKWDVNHEQFLLYDEMRQAINAKKTKKRESGRLVDVRQLIAGTIRATHNKFL